jgi:hypothetical protein
MKSRAWLFLMLVGIPSFAHSQQVASEFTVNVRDRNQQSDPIQSRQQTGRSADRVLPLTNVARANNQEAAGNTSIASVETALPNLVPYRPFGWSNPIVVTTDSGSTVDAEYIYSDEPVFIDWAIANFGSATAKGPFKILLSIDGNGVNWIANNSLLPGYYNYWIGYNAGKLSVGSHTFRIVADPANQIQEQNENDNQYSEITSVLSSTIPKIKAGPTIITLNRGLAPAPTVHPWIPYNPLSIQSAATSVLSAHPHALGLRIPESVKREVARRMPKTTLYGSTPPSLDWSGNDSPVKDQGVCGACWAFAAVGLVENVGLQTDLAEQVVVSCAAGGDCSGGWYGDALTYIKNTGIPGEACYPYTQSNGDCGNETPLPPFIERLSSVTAVLWAQPAVADLRAALVQGPVVVSMSVYSDFDAYTTGIYHHHSGSYLGGHAVLVVGYNDSLSCFKVKNSWGTSWGEGGYFRISYSDLSNDVKFGGYGMQASGAYTQTCSQNKFVVQNVGGGPLVLASMTINRPWLSIVPASMPMTVGRRAIDTFSVSVDWPLVGLPRDTATITINSNDPAQPSVQIQIIAVPDSVQLPIQLTSFLGSWTGGSTVCLRWSTASESKNYGFEVERSSSISGGYAVLPHSFLAGSGTTLDTNTYVYYDSTASPGVNYYRLRQIDLDATVHFSEPIRITFKLTDVTPQINVPGAFRLDQNFPNPFNPTTSIRFSVATSGRTTLKLFNYLGQEITTLYDAIANPGQMYTVRFDGRAIASGVYLYQLTNRGHSLSKRLVLLK